MNKKEHNIIDIVNNLIHHNNYINDEKVIKRIYTMISDFFYTKNKINELKNSIIISGSFGSGKTTFVNDINSYVKNTNNQIEFIRFDLKNYTLCDDLIYRLVLDLLYKINDKLPKTTLSINNFTKKQSELLKIIGLFNKIPFKGAFYELSNSFEENVFQQKNTLNEKIDIFLSTLKKYIGNKKIIIFFDELDIISNQDLNKIIILFYGVLVKIKKIFFIISLDMETLLNNKQNHNLNSIVNQNIDKMFKYTYLIYLKNIVSLDKNILKLLNKEENILIKYLYYNTIDFNNFDLGFLNNFLLYEVNNKKLNQMKIKTNTILMKGLVFHLGFLKKTHNLKYIQMINKIKFMQNEIITNPSFKKIILKNTKVFELKLPNWFNIIFIFDEFSFKILNNNNNNNNNIPEFNTWNKYTKDLFHSINALDNKENYFQKLNRELNIDDILDILFETVFI